MSSKDVDVCDQCSYKTQTIGNLRKHKKSQHSGNIYPCDVCDYKAKLAMSLRDHKEMRHGINKYFCEKCDYKSPLYKYFRVHKKSHEVHKFLCNQCEFKARQSSNLKKHVDMVHGKIRFKCDVCVYTAATKYLLKVHRLSKHEG